MALEAHAFEVQFQRRPSLPRAQLVAAAEKRDAKAATSDIAERLTQWHLEIARLRGLAEFRRSRNLDPSVVLAITTLAADLDAHRSLFADSLRGLPPGLASSGWIRDIIRALDRASEMVSAIKADGGRAS